MSLWLSRYDRVPRQELSYWTRKSGVAEMYVRLMQDMYEDSGTVIRSDRWVQSGV